jgi:hypothetical protein
MPRIGLISDTRPGSAGPRRFRLPVAVAELIVDGDGPRARIVELTIRDRGA